MKIAIITSGILPVPAVQGGAVENLIDYLLEYNDEHRLHEITVYSVFHPNVYSHPALQSTINRYEYIHTETKIFKYISKLRVYLGYSYSYHHRIEYFLEKAWRKMKRIGFDLIILENRPGYSVILKKYTKIPQIAHIHYDMLNNPEHLNWFKPLLGIICVSDYLYKSAPDEIKAKCVTVHNGIDLRKFVPIPQKLRDAYRDKYHIKPTDIVLVFCGRIDPIKGVKELIESILLLKNRNIKLLIIGGSFYGNEYADSKYIIETKRISEKIKDQIIFTGFKPYSEIPSLLALGDIAVIPSICDDAYPTTVLEAMAMGMPIIATNRGGIPEQVNNENAILVNTDKELVRNLAQAIQKIAEDPKLRYTMAEASHKKSSSFNKNRYAHDFFHSITIYSLDKNG